MAQPLQAPLPGYSPYQQDVLALMNNQFKAQTLGNISAIRRRVIKLLCPVHPRHEGFCLAVLHTLHDALFGLPTQASTEPLSHYATANAILTFTGLPALGSKAREQQVCAITHMHGVSSGPVEARSQTLSCQGFSCVLSCFASPHEQTTNWSTATSRLLPYTWNHCPFCLEPSRPVLRPLLST